MLIPILYNCFKVITNVIRVLKIHILKRECSNEHVNFKDLLFCHQDQKSQDPRQSTMNNIVKFVTVDDCSRGKNGSKLKEGHRLLSEKADTQTNKLCANNLNRDCLE